MYIGRFAPSPTGPLHFGSMVAAVASYLEAVTQKGKWLVRIENLDPPREIAGSASHILTTLETYGMQWDGAILYQSQRSAAYEEALERLKQQCLLYPCTCSRKEIAAIARNGIEGPIYPGTCRSGYQPGEAQAWRLRTDSTTISFNDAVQGRQAQQLEQDIGDFVLKRADGLYAYQLAVVVDDQAQGITHIVRGSDLLASTPRQIYIQQLLGFPQPHYSHVPVAVNPQGEKLSKQTQACPVDLNHPQPVLWQVLAWLGQRPPHELRHASLDALWTWAKASWQIAQIPRQLTLPTPR